jgi:hypothetical protein
LVEHNLFGKPASTFPDHDLEWSVKEKDQTRDGTGAVNKLLRLLLIAGTVLIAHGANTAPVATQAAAMDQCRLYGFTPGSRDYAECRMDVRRYWTTGPCGSARFAAIHRGYCRLNPPPFI